jgi:hypothetical protein
MESLGVDTGFYILRNIFLKNFTQNVFVLFFRIFDFEKSILVSSP